MWSLHAERSSLWLNATSAASVHVSHTMSVDAVPAVSLPSPAGHVDQATHDASLLTPLLYVAVPHAVQVLSAASTLEAV